MTKGNSRFDYVANVKKDGAATEETTSKPEPALANLIPKVDVNAFRSVPRREGRAEQKTQLNVRVPKELKRHALAQAALEGRTVGELIETLLIDYLEKVGNIPKG